MAYGSGSRLVDNIERKFGHLAIPSLLHWLAGFQFLVFVLAKLDPNYMNLLTFDRDLILEGQVWRLFSYVFFPRTTSFIWILFAVLFLWFISNGLESAWGSFRVNLYLYGCLFCLTAIGLIFPSASGAGALLSMLVYSNLFFAFASIYPNQEILLMLIIPIKIKYLAWVGAGILLLIALASPLIGLFLLAGLLPYLVVFGPNFIRDMKQRGKAANRKSKFIADTRAPAGEAFHSCTSCGIDDIADPTLEFRVAADGDEFCLPCLKVQQDGDEDEESSS
ncbi:MAG: rhomboid family intramembrane serine protease [Verrucomicrobiota bacterium]